MPDVLLKFPVMVLTLMMTAGCFFHTSAFALRNSNVDYDATKSGRDLNDSQSLWFTPRLGRKIENEPEVTLGDFLNEYPVWFLPLPYKEKRINRFDFIPRLGRTVYDDDSYIQRTGIAHYFSPRLGRSELSL